MTLPPLPSTPLDKAHGREVVWPQVSELFAAARTIVGKFVYLIGEEDDGPVKIGLAADPIKRLRAMQTGNSRRLRVEYVLLGDMPTEKLLHEMWEPFAIDSARRRGPDSPPGTEWFRAEIREQLFPIVATAATKQTELLLNTTGDLCLNTLEAIVRDAHDVHGFAPKQRHEVRLLGASAGYVTPRPSRI